MGEEGGPDAPGASAPDFELVPGQGTGLERNCRRLQHKSKTDLEKIEWFSDLKSS